MATQVTTKAPGADTDYQPVQNKHTFGHWIREYGWRHLVGVLIVIYAMVPIIYILSASLNPGGTLTGSNQLFQTIDFANYENLSSTMFWHWMGNSLVIAISVSIGTVLMAAAAAYAFSRFRFAGRRFGLTALLITSCSPRERG